jgi:hypothetical protein
LARLDFNADSKAGQVWRSTSKYFRFALDTILFFADNTPNIIKAMTEESTSVEAAREVWSIG